MAAKEKKRGGTITNFLTARMNNPYILYWGSSLPQPPQKLIIRPYSEPLNSPHIPDTHSTYFSRYQHQAA
jgi:hypothetical protein